MGDGGFYFRGLYVITFYLFEYVPFLSGCPELGSRGGREKNDFVNWILHCLLNSFRVATFPIVTHYITLPENTLVTMFCHI
jgi:hypothetical protein